MIEAGQIEVVQSQGGAQVYQQTYQTTNEVPEAYESGEKQITYGDQVYYAKPFIAQTQEVISRPYVE